MSKTPISFEWLSGCSGCEVSVVDLHERLLNVLEKVEIVRLPILVDVKGYPKAKLGLLSGALRTEHDITSAKKMRESCDIIMAFGTCAVFGGPQGSGFAHTLDELTDAAFRKNSSTRTDTVPNENLSPLLASGVRPVDSVIEIDRYLPGCPPHPSFIFEALISILENREPDFGSHNVCFKCNRKMKKTDVTTLRRYHDGPVDPELCFLSQGIICSGSAALDRCLAPCPKHGVPCLGCAGPSEHIILEPYRDVRTEMAQRMSMLTQIPMEDIVTEIEKQAKTYYAYAMTSPVFRQKPTFLLQRWVSSSEGDRV